MGLWAEYEKGRIDGNTQCLNVAPENEFWLVYFISDNLR